MDAKSYMNDYILKRKDIKDYSTKIEKFNEIYNNFAKDDVFDFLAPNFDNLTIEVTGDYKGNIMHLMSKGYLEGWCFQTTESAIMFLDDNSYIVRGNLKFSNDYFYFHSWIVFNYDNTLYVFDPCLKILVKKEIYDRVFEVEEFAKVSAKSVKDYFIDYVNNYSPKIDDNPITKQFTSFIETIIPKEVLDRQRNEIKIGFINDLYHPMCKNGAGYTPEIKNNKIKKLTAHFYSIGY